MYFSEAQRKTTFHLGTIPMSYIFVKKKKVINTLVMVIDNIDDV